MENQNWAMLLGLLIIIGGLTLEALFAKPIFAYMQRHNPKVTNPGDLLWLWYGLGMGAFVAGLLVMYGLGSG